MAGLLQSPQQQSQPQPNTACLANTEATDYDKGIMSYMQPDQNNQAKAAPNDTPNAASMATPSLPISSNLTNACGPGGTTGSVNMTGFNQELQGYQNTENSQALMSADKQLAQQIQSSSSSGCIFSTILGFAGKIGGFIGSFL